MQAVPILILVVREAIAESKVIDSSLGIAIKESPTHTCDNKSHVSAVSAIRSKSSVFTMSIRPLLLDKVTPIFAISSNLFGYLNFLVNFYVTVLFCVVSRNSRLFCEGGYYLE